MQWAPDSERPHIAQMKILESIVVFGRWTLPGSQVNVNVTQCISQVRAADSAQAVFRVTVYEHSCLSGCD